MAREKNEEASIKKKLQRLKIPFIKVISEEIHLGKINTLSLLLEELQKIKSRYPDIPFRISVIKSHLEFTYSRDLTLEEMKSLLSEFYKNEKDKKEKEISKLQQELKSLEERFGGRRPF